MKKQYPLFDIYWDEQDVESIANVIRRGSYWAVGPEIKKFESEFAKYFKRKYCLAFSNGTTALHSLILAHGITSGEVIVPSFTFIATANAVIHAGATPIFADIEMDTLGLDVESVESKITSNTKAIIPMHYGGKVCRKIKKLKNLAKKYNIPLIEDNAESFGAKLDGKFAGTFGDSAILSFCQNKILPTGEGGAVITDSKSIYKRLQLIRSHGRVEQSNVDYFHDINTEDYVEVGYNFRMPSICAALGSSQLKKIDTIIKKRREIGLYYDHKLKEINGVEIIPELNNSFNVFQLYSICIKDKNRRSELQEFLLRNGIYSKIYFAPIHLKSFYRNTYGCKEGDFPNTEEVSNKILTLPMSFNFTQNDQDNIIECIRSFFEK